MESIELLIPGKIKKARGGSLFFVDDFLRFGNSKAMDISFLTIPPVSVCQASI